MITQELTVPEVANSPTATPRPAKPRLGFLGVGWIGRHRLEALARSGVAEIGAIADSSPELATQAAQACAGAEVMASLEELLEADLEGIVIATPSALHAEQTRAALKAGRAVFCQKPLGRNGAETHQVIAAARQADRLLGVDLSYRFMSGVRRIYELCQAGELGDVYAVELVFHNAYGPDKPWFYDRRLSGGGCVIDLGIHLVDLALWALNCPKTTAVTSRLFAQGKPLRGRAHTVEDYAEAQLELETGAVVRLACSWKLPAGCDAIISGSFYGTKGGAAFRNVNGSFYEFVAERFHGTRRETLASGPEEWGGQAAIDWAHRLAAGGGYAKEIEHLLPVAEALDAIYESSAS